MRDLRPDEASVSAAIHRQVLDMEFLARFGTGFLTAYHRAWIRSPAGLSLAATDSSGRITGVMLGSLDPAAHYDWLLRKAGAGLGVRMGAYALVHPSLARELVATRAGRYTRAVAVRVAARARRALSGAGRDGTGQGADLSSNPSPARRAGEITHLMVVPDGRGGGSARAGNGSYGGAVVSLEIPLSEPGTEQTSRSPAAIRTGRAFPPGDSAGHGGT